MSLNIIIQVFKTIFLVNLQSRMVKGNARGGRRAGGRARSDAEEDVEDSQAELNDITAALNTSDKPAGESAGEGRHSLPDGLLQRRYEKEKNGKEQAIKEKELLQKQMDDMRAKWQLEQANNAKLKPVLLPPARHAQNYFEVSL